MMDATTVTLDEQHFKVVTAIAIELGTTPALFIHSLIDAATSSFDEILSPVREAFASSRLTEEELDAAVTHARKVIHQQDSGK